MADLPYESWFAYYRKFFPTPCTAYVAELFSGPGVIAALARAEGLAAISLDRHLPFLAGNSSVCADAVELPLTSGSLAAAIAANCSINYLMPGQLTQHFAEVARALIAGGVYGFELCGEERATAVNGNQQTLHAAGVRFAHVYHSHLELLETTVQLPDGTEELHPQYIFSETEVIHKAQSVGFTLVEQTKNYGISAGSLPPIDTYVFRIPHEQHQ